MKIPGDARTLDKVTDDIPSDASNSKENANLKELTNDTVSMKAKVKDNEPSSQQVKAKSLTWLEKMWALIPFKQEDWIKNVKTQERP